MKNILTANKRRNRITSETERASRQCHWRLYHQEHEAAEEKKTRTASAIKAKRKGKQGRRRQKLETSSGA
jgi:hypothetical protein